MHPSVSGSIVGMVGASAFMLISRPELPEPLRVPVMAAWLLLLAATAWAVLLRRRVLPDLRPPEPSAGLVYFVSVAAMVFLIILAPGIVRTLDIAPAQPALVVLTVGLHFIPFATAFHAPVFGRLGIALSLVGLAGIIAAIVWGPPWGSLCAVTAGVVMFVVLLLEVLRPAPAVAVLPRDDKVAT